MSRVPMLAYFFVLVCALLIAGSASLSWAGFVAIAAFGLMCLVLLEGLRTTDVNEAHASHHGAAHASDGYTLGEDAQTVRVPHHILDYLWSNHVRFVRRGHARAVTAQQLAHSLHVPGQQVAKPVLVRADGEVWMAVLPATERINFHALRDTLCARTIEMVPEHEIAKMFPDCELGAEPPFGHLYHLPMIVDSDLKDAQPLVLRGGFHDQAIELSYEEFERLEHPVTAHFAEPAN